MPKYPVHLERAPINEAILDIRLEFPNSINIEHFESFHSKIIEAFPNKQVSNKFETLLEFKVGEKATTKTETGPNGIIFKSSDGLKILQMRNDGFTLNKLKPYENWDSLLKEAREYWNLYRSVIGKTKIIRVALRYINEIEIANEDELDEYITLGPNLPESYSDSVSQLFTRFYLKDSVSDCKANVILATASKEDGKISIIFDIDVFQNVDISSDQEWAKIFQQLHDLKNKIFFDSITDKVIERYK